MYQLIYLHMRREKSIWLYNTGHLRFPILCMLFCMKEFSRGGVLHACQEFPWSSHRLSDFGGNMV